MKEAFNYEQIKIWSTLKHLDKELKIILMNLSYFF